MKQEDWEAALTEARAKMGRLAQQAQALTPDEYKALAIERKLKMRPVLVEQIEDMARMPDDVLAAQRGISVGEAAALLAAYRAGTPDEVFDRQIEEMRQMPAEQLQAKDTATLTRMASGTGFGRVEKYVTSDPLYGPRSGGANDAMGESQNHETQH